MYRGFETVKSPGEIFTTTEGTEMEIKQLAELFLFTTSKTTVAFYIVIPHSQMSYCLTVL